MTEQPQFDEKDLLLQHQNSLNEKAMNALSNDLARVSRERAIFVAQSADFQEQLKGVIQELENVKAENEELKKEINKLKGNEEKGEDK
ncbi:hypothetical protein ACNRWW_14010 [Metabacillus sp. HB246100]